jgi:subtilisin family serine protease
MRRIFPDAGKYEAKHRKYGLHLWYEISIPETEDPEIVAKEFGLDGNIQVAQPKYKTRSLAMPAPSPEQWLPNDPDFDKQWHFENTGQTGGVAGVDIKLKNAWGAIDTLGLNNKQVVVAVTDGGVYYDHEDLYGNMWINEAEKNGIAGEDDDLNEYVDDIHGYNFVERRGRPIGTIQPEDHATHVAGTIAAVTNNYTGVSGMGRENYRIRVMTVQILNDTPNASVSLENAFIYAADNGAVISQNSWGYDDPDVYNQTDLDAINYFIQEAGTDENGVPREGTPMIGGIVIFAAGNDNRDAKWYPAYFDNVLAVASVNHYGKRAWYSNYGDWIDISAPGGDTRESGIGVSGGIYSTSYNASNPNYYEYMQGTSMACPQVSGAAALILSVYGDENFTPDMLRTRLLNTTMPLYPLDPTNAAAMGSGLLNTEAAVAPGGVPEAVLDLVVKEVGNSWGEVAWEVPAVSNNGKVAYFEVAYATVPITGNNFNMYSGFRISSSVESGSQQEYTITGLQPETSYYAAIRSTGNSGDKSEISNRVTFTTNPNQAPEIKGLFNDTTLIPYTTLEINLSEYITDPDGDSLDYQYVVEHPEILNVNIKNDTLSITPQSHGSVALYLSVSDPYSASDHTTIHINIEQKYAPEKSGELLIYPNPTRDILYYSFVLEESASANIRIINTKGSIIYETSPARLNPGTHYFNLNISNWNSDLYFIQLIKNGKAINTKKMIKL